jgi:tetratricopeptide (TPR) repeat protein
MTVNEKRFNNYVQVGISKYDKAVEAKSTKNTIKLADLSIENMRNALQLAKIVNKKEKEPYLWEYITLCEALKGMTYYEGKDLKEAIVQFNLARESNKKTLKNQETIIRDLYLLEKLVNIASLQQNWGAADNISQLIYGSALKVKELQKKIDYLVKIKNIFIESKNLSYIKKCYSKLIKLCNNEDSDLDKSKATIYSDYARFLEIVMKKKKKAAEFYDLAIELFKKLDLNADLARVIEQRNEMNKS